MSFISTVSSQVNTTVATAYNSRKLVKDGNGRLHAVYMKVATKRNIYHAYSDDNGHTWTEEAITSDITNPQSIPSLAVDGNNNLHVVWYGASPSSTYLQIRYSKYTTSWSSPIDITSGNYHQYYPFIAVDNSNNLHVIWNGYSASSSGYFQIRYSKYVSSWSSPIDITSGNYNQYLPSLAVDSSNNLHTVWRGKSAFSITYYQIRYSKYVSSWSDPIDITSGDYTQSNPFIAIDNNNDLHVVWGGYSATSPSYYQIRYSKYISSWSDPVDLTSGNYNQDSPSIAINSNNNLYVVWSGNSVSSTVYAQIRYSKYTTSWSSPVDLTSETSHQYYPNASWNSTNGFNFIWCSNGLYVKFYSETKKLFAMGYL